VDLDPRSLGRPVVDASASGGAGERYGDAECLRCGDCVEACRMVFSIRPRATPPLRFGRQPAQGGARDATIDAARAAIREGSHGALAKLDADAAAQSHVRPSGGGRTTVEDPCR
jgi:ferredoxin